MPSKSFEVKTYDYNVGFKNSASWGVSITIQGYVVGRGAAGERLIVYGLHPSSAVPPNSVCNWAGNVGAIFVPFNLLPQYLDILRNEKPVYASLNSDKPEWMAFSTSNEPIGEGE